MAQPGPGTSDAGGSGPVPRLPSQRHTPYLDALTGYADRNPGRYHIPAHKGGPGADAGMIEAFGQRALEMDIPAMTPGIDVGPEPTPFQQAQLMAAEAWGAARTWFLMNGATQGNHAACLSLAQLGAEIVVQRNVHSSIVDGLVLSGLRPTFAAPEIDAELGIAHCVTPAALDDALQKSRDAVGAVVVSPTYFGACADVAGLAKVAHEHGVPLVVDEAWGGHLAFHEELPEDALAAGADLVVSSTHKLVGSLTQSAMLHLSAGGEERIGEHIVDRSVTLGETTSPSALLGGSLDAARRNAAAHGREHLDRSLAGVRALKRAIMGIPGLDVIDERLAGSPGIHAYDPLRVTIDVRGAGVSGYELAQAAIEIDDVHFEMAVESVIVPTFGMAEPVEISGRRLAEALSRAVEKVSAARSRETRKFAPPPPWGPLEMTPREAFLGPQDAIPFKEAAGRVAAESLAAYPPGVPNVMPGERLTDETLAFISRVLEEGGTLRGASDRTLRTVRIAVEAGRR